MGVGQSSANALTGAIIGSALTATKVVEGLSEDKKPEAPKAEEPKQDTGIDAKMAAKARKTAQQKINAIYANQELSNKARTRRMGQVIDEYNETISGGNK